MYSLTNKKGAMEQIGKKYICKEALRTRTHENEETIQASLEDHHSISESRNTPISIFNFVQTNPQDSAKSVSFCFSASRCLSSVLTTLRLSSISSKTISLAALHTASLMVTPTKPSLIRTAIQSGLETTQCTVIALLTSITQHMICVVILTP